MGMVHTDDGTRVAYRQLGNGDEKVLLIHGFNCSGHNFDWVTPYFNPQQYTLVIPDLRGSGESDKPATGYTIERFARDMLAVIDALGWEQGTYSVVGHSTGAAIAQWMAAEPGYAFKALVLAGPVPATGVPLPPEGEAMFTAAAESSEGKAVVWQAGWSTPLASDLLDRLVTDSLTWRREAVLETFTAWSNANFPERLPAITAPTLVIGAEHEPFLNAAFLHEKVVSQIAGAQYVEVPGSSHYMHIEQAAYTAGVIATYIATRSA